MKKSLLFILVSIIFLLGVFVRFYQLGATPNAMNWDEVSWGYNAYSIEKTGRDEYGTFLPLSFRAFGDFKQPVYVYSAAVAIKLFGLTPFATRLPSAFFGSLSILFLFFLVRELFHTDRRRDIYALVAMAFYALSPWSIQFSRVAYEANIALSLVLAGFALFFSGVHKKQYILLFLSTVLLSLSTYTYHSEKIVTPLLFVGLLIVTYRFFLTRRLLALGLVVFFVICSSFWLLDLRTTQRGRSVLFFSDSTRVLGRSVEKIEYEKANHLPLATIVHNRRIIYAKQFASNYLSHFDPKYLFLTGDQPQHHAPDVGILYLVSLPFILLGIYFLIRNGIGESWFLFFWFFVSPIASSLAIDAPNASRNLIMAPTWDIFAALGIVLLWKIISEKRRYIVFSVLGVLFFANVIFYLHQYFVHTNKENGKYWQYGYKEAVWEAQKLDDGKRKIVFANDVEQGYAFYLFYTRFDPITYQAIAKDQKAYDCRIIKNIQFGCTLSLQKGDIYISTKGVPFKNNTVVKTIPYANGDTAVTVYEYE